MTLTTNPSQCGRLTLFNRPQLFLWASKAMLTGIRVNTKRATTGLRKVMPKLLTHRAVFEVVKERRGDNNSQIATKRNMPKKKPRRIRTSLAKLFLRILENTTDRFHEARYGGASETNTPCNTGAIVLTSFPKARMALAP